jgi:hypothetical protein
MFLMVDVENQTGAGASAVEGEGANHGTEGADSGVVPGADLRRSAIAAAKTGKIGAFAVRAANPDRVFERTKRVSIGRGDEGPKLVFR